MLPMDMRRLVPWYKNGGGRVDTPFRPVPFPSHDLRRDFTVVSLMNTYNCNTESDEGFSNTTLFQLTLRGLKIKSFL